MTLLHFIPGWHKWALENDTARNGLRELTCIRRQISDLYFASPLTSAAIHSEQDGSDSLYRAEQMSALVRRRVVEELDCMWVSPVTIYCCLLLVNLHRGGFLYSLLK